MRRAVSSALALAFAATSLAQAPSSPAQATLGYHQVRLDASGGLLPWFADDPAASYDHVIGLVWQFWHQMRRCENGVPYYLQHQVWKPDRDDPRGLGGDQISMALSSWNRLHAYTGDEAIVADMRLMADHWLETGLTPSSAAWPWLPYPYNLEVHSGRYDGDMRAGPGVIQPDKAASFGAELMTLYKVTNDRKYLTAARRIADTLARHVTAGSASISPWPFRVDAATGDLARPRAEFAQDDNHVTANQLWTGYTSNWTDALRLFEELSALGKATPEYARARRITRAWLDTYPLRTNNWGPFFEDIVEYSNTAINADTMAQYLLERPTVDERSLRQARSTLDWVERTFNNHRFQALGVEPINEQTVYQQPGNSHTARHAAVELLYAEKSGDWSRKRAQVQRLNWATYMVDTDGKNRYPGDDIWLTDGYGDYVRHYLRAMAASPDLAPADQNHLLRTTSVIQTIQYGADRITYTKFDRRSIEMLKLGAWTPGRVTGGVLQWSPASDVAHIRADGRTVTIERAR
jgi:hypothetical protein